MDVALKTTYTQSKSRFYFLLQRLRRTYFQKHDIFTHYIKNTTTLTLFALNFLHSVVREFNNCTTQGKVTRKAIKEKQTQQFKIHNTILIAFMATTIQENVTIDGDEPAYGSRAKNTDRNTQATVKNCGIYQILNFQTPPAEFNCLLQAAFFLQLGLARTFGRQ